MSTIEIKSKKSYLIVYLTLTLATVVSSLYFLFLTDYFPEQTTKIAGTVANFIILLYMANFALQLNESLNGKLVILLNGFQKKTQKTPKSEIEKAERLMSEYYQDKANDHGN